MPRAKADLGRAGHLFERRSRMDDTTLLADHIDREIDTILGLWRATVERFGSVPASEGLSRREFMDHIPELLERLADRLRGEDADLAESGQKHGQQRWSQGYEVSEVVAELGQLRSTLVRDIFKFARSRRFDIVQAERLIEAVDAVIDGAMAASVRQFEEDSRGLNRAVLDEFESRKADGKRLEADLAISEARFRGIVAKSPVMIWRADPAGSCDFFNETWLEFRGRTEAEEAGRGWTAGVHPDDLDRCLEARGRGIERRETFESVYRLLHADGRHRWVTERGVPYDDAQGNFLGLLGSCLDITARIELEGKLEQQSQHKSRLMAALSHDARTPLNAVVLSAKLLESQVKDLDDPEVRDSLTTIRNAVRNVLDLLSDLLDLSRIDAGATMAETSRFDLQETLTECLSNIEPQARATGLDVQLDEDGLDDVRLDTDRAKLKQILSNFLSNALNYTERGRIRVFLKLEEGQVRIGVEDSGVGIAPENLTRIFDEFAVLEHPNRPRGEGTGLGLAICRRLANLLHGEILLESTPGRGSTFVLALPESVLTREAPPVEHPVPAPDRNFGGPILIAEDHADSRKTLAKVLRRFGYRVQEAADGGEVLELVRQERPMLVLMDVNMPGLDGVETTLALRKDPKSRDLTIFALTGDVSVLNQRRIGEAGVDGYLEKPVTWEKLEAVLARLHPPSGPTKV